MAEIAFEEIGIPIGPDDDPIFTFLASGTFEIDDEGYVETINIEGRDSYGEPMWRTFYPNRSKARAGHADEKLICILADQIETQLKDKIEDVLADLRESRADGPEFVAAE